jgi:hypothetical protein
MRATSPTLASALATRPRPGRVHDGWLSHARRRVLLYLAEYGPTPAAALPRFWSVPVIYLEALLRDLIHDQLIDVGPTAADGTRPLLAVSERGHLVLELFRWRAAV